MRRLIPAVALMLAATWAVAQDPAAPPAGPPDRPGEQAREAEGKKEMTAIVVSTDATVKTITVRSETGAPGAQPKTLPVAGAAVARLSSIKEGEKVKLVLSIDPATNKESVTSIEKSEHQSEEQEP